MASGVPVTAVDAPGVREVVKDKINGCLLRDESVGDFFEALEWIAQQKEEKKERLKKECRKTAEEFGKEKSIEHALKIYQALVLNKAFIRRQSQDSAWERTVRLIQAHWDLVKNLAKATTEALLHSH